MHELLRLKNVEGAIPAFNVFGYEDAITVVEAAEEVHAPVILATNKIAIDHMPIKILSKILISIAESASVPVVVHLDHGASFEIVAEAIMNGYTSVMYDGSHLPLEENIRRTKEIVHLAHACNIPVEAEIGSVGYKNLNEGQFTEPEEAKVFAEETGVDILAVSIGTVHRMEKQSAKVNFDLLRKIEDVVHVPLVLHGSTGVTDEDMKKLIKHRFVKVNIGTALRIAFGHSLRDQLEENPLEFDRIVLFQQPMKEVKKVAKNKLTLLNASLYFSEQTKY